MHCIRLECPLPFRTPLWFSPCLPAICPFAPPSSKAAFAAPFRMEHPSLVLILVWLLHYEGGLEYDSDEASRVFNVHPFLMYFGFIFMDGEGIYIVSLCFLMTGKIKKLSEKHPNYLERKVQKKLIHMLFHLIAICLGIVGIKVVFKWWAISEVGNGYSASDWWRWTAGGGTLLGGETGSTDRFPISFCLPFSFPRERVEVEFGVISDVATCTWKAVI